MGRKTCDRAAPSPLPFQMSPDTVAVRIPDYRKAPSGTPPRPNLPDYTPRATASPCSPFALVFLNKAGPIEMQGATYDSAPLACQANCRFPPQRAVASIERGVGTLREERCMLWRIAKRPGSMLGQLKNSDFIP